MECRLRWQECHGKQSCKIETRHIPSTMAPSTQVLASLVTSHISLAPGRAIATKSEMQQRRRKQRPIGICEPREAWGKVLTMSPTTSHATFAFFSRVRRGSEGCNIHVPGIYKKGVRDDLGVPFTS